MKVAEFFENSEWPLCSLLVSKKHRVIYTPIAKNANTSLKRLFVRLSGHTRRDEILNDNVHIHLTSNQTGLSLCDYSPEEATEILNDPSYFRYVVLRNPLERAVSGYLDKFVRHPPPSGTGGEAPMVIGAAIDWVYAHRGEKPDYNRSITFLEFVNYLAQNDDDNLDTHFKSQESYLDQQKFDFIGTVEQMKSLPQVLEPLFNQYVEIEHSHRVLRRKLFLRRGRKEMLLPKHLRAQRALPHASELLNIGISEQLKNRYSTDYEFWHSALIKGQAR
jgi:hypothetical protein